MKKTIRIPMLIAPGGHFYATAYDGQEPIDWSFLWDSTEGWPCDEADIQKRFVEVEVDFPDAEVPVVKGSVAPAANDGGAKP